MADNKALKAITKEMNQTMKLNESITLWISEVDRQHLERESIRRDRSKGWLIREMITKDIKQDQKETDDESNN